MEAVISMPAWGIWHAELVVDNADASALAAGVRVTLATADGGLSLIGTVRAARTGVFLDSTRLRVIGGAGGLGVIVGPKQFERATVKLPLAYILGATGETLSGATASAVLASQLVRWHIVQQSGAAAIAVLMSATPSGTVWRVLPDGTVWLGPETWPSISSSYEFTVEDSKPNEARHVIAAESPAILPGQSIPDLGNVGYVEHRIVPDKIRSLVWMV